MAAVKKLASFLLALGAVAALLLLGSVVFNGTVSAVTGTPTARIVLSAYAKGERCEASCELAVWRVSC